MRAVLQIGYGDPERATKITEIETPTATGKQVLVRVVASSVNAMDWRSVYGSPSWIRLVSGLRGPRDPALGGDAAGVVEAVGPDVTNLKLGDEVFGIRTGSFGEFVAGENFVRKPANATFEQAAAVPVAGVTALQALTKHGFVKPGERVLVNGAGGGVGSFSVQIAKALGADVTAVTSTDKVDAIRGLGVDKVIDYKREDFTKIADRYDLIVDVGGNRSIGAMQRVLSPAGRLVLPAAGKGRFGVLGRVIGTTIRKRLGQPVKFYVASGPYEEQLSTLREMIEAGQVTPLIDRTYALNEIAEAIRYVRTEKARGKVVVKIG